MGRRRRPRSRAPPHRTGPAQSGRSTRLPATADWRVRDYPARVADLADAMDLKRFTVWGCLEEAHARWRAPPCLPEPPVWPSPPAWARWAAGRGFDDFAEADRSMLRMAARQPCDGRAILGTSARLARLSPEPALKSSRKELSPADREVLDAAGSATEVMALFTEAFTDGPRGVVADSRPRPRVGARLRLYHHAGVDLARRRGHHGSPRPLPGASRQDSPGTSITVWPGAGHLGTIANVEAILDWLFG